jgi:hypothetical protein
MRPKKCRLGIYLMFPKVHAGLRPAYEIMYIHTYGASHRDAKDAI